MPRRRSTGGAARTAAGGSAASTASASRCRRAGDPRLLLGGRDLRPLRRQAAADRGEWEKAACGTRRRGAPAPTRGATKPHPSAPTSTSSLSVPPRWGPTRPGSAPTASTRCGDAGEWTSSDFLPYLGFAAFPYPEYSEVFFGRIPGCSAAAPGPPGREWPVEPSALGLPHPPQSSPGIRCPGSRSGSSTPRASHLRMLALSVRRRDRREGDRVEIEQLLDICHPTRSHLPGKKPPGRS